MALKLTNSQFKTLLETPQRRTYTVAIGTAVVVVLLVFFAIRPAIGSIFDKINENKELERIKGELDVKYENLISLNKQEQEKAEKLEMLDAAMPVGRNEEFLVANLMGLIENNNLDLVTISISTQSGKSVIDSSALGNRSKNGLIAISVQGQREDVVNFVQAIENFPRTLNIRRFNLTPNTQDKVNNGYQVNADIEAEYYYYDFDNV